MAESGTQAALGEDRPAPRPSIDWEAPEFLDASALDDELRRVAGVCHTCRRCEDLCESFPRLFDLIDRAGSVEAVKSADFESVGAACTLCDMCYPVCPYVPPHVHAVDFPALMIRQRARAKGKVGLFERALGSTDRNGRLFGAIAPLANWAARRGNRLTRSLMEAFAGIHRDAVLPRFHARSFSRQAAAHPSAVDTNAPAAGRKAVLYATCFVEYNNPASAMQPRACWRRTASRPRSSTTNAAGCRNWSAAILARSAAEPAALPRRWSPGSSVAGT